MDRMRFSLAVVALLVTGCEALTGDFHAVGGAGGDAGQSAGGSDGGGTVGPCGKVDMLVDDFEDGILGPPWMDSIYGTALFSEAESVGVAYVVAGSGGASRGVVANRQPLRHVGRQQGASADRRPAAHGGRGQHREGRDADAPGRR